MLPRALTIAHPVGSAARRRSDLAYALSLAALTLAAVVAVVELAERFAPRSRMRVCTESTRTTALIGVRKYAYEAYPSWRADHPDRACPTLGELRAYQNGPPIDPWDTALRHVCRPRRAPLVISAGEDGRFGTADDISSTD